MSERRLLYVMDVLKTSFVCYGCLKDVLCMLWMSQRCPLYVMDVSKTFHYYLKKVLYAVSKILETIDLTESQTIIDD